MILCTIIYFFCLLVNQCFSQGPLSVEYIMRDPKWIGVSPSSLRWGADGTLYFKYNPDGAEADSLYSLNTKDMPNFSKVSDQSQEVLYEDNLIRNPSDPSMVVYNRQGNIFLRRMKGDVKKIFSTQEYEWATGFSSDGKYLVYKIGNDIFSYNLEKGFIRQLLAIQSASLQDKKKKLSNQDQVLMEEQKNLFDVFIQEKKVSKKSKEKRDYLVYERGSAEVVGTSISNDLLIAAIRLKDGRTESHTTIMPKYVTESGYTETVNTRAKVGIIQPDYSLKFYNFEKDTLMDFLVNDLPGINAMPNYLEEYPVLHDSLAKASAKKSVNIFDPLWSPNGHLAVVQVYSFDNKDRWIVLFDADSGIMKIIDHQHDEAWIGGPNIGGNYWPGWCVWLDDDHVAFTSEISGYAHLYKYEISSGKIIALTSGNYEVQRVTLAPDRKSLYLLTNQNHPGTKTFVKLALNSLKQIVLLNPDCGLDEVTVSPDGKWIAYLQSTTNQPWELFISENKAGGKSTRITDKAISREFGEYPWQSPKVITFRASDGREVYARLYKSRVANPNKPGVIFVHGAGYLQNAHKWWSSYFREYMFHNLLTDLGYTVLDIDYRASSGYGRDWRTAIYRHMGGTDLSDQVDGVKYLKDSAGVNINNIGIYGGSYGGFITLMALFTKPGVFQAGAALRPVTDWMHYNHGYTSNILNVPALDSIAYARSSPINFVDGLKDRLLICHGMVDDNVHFQDVVRLQQVLIDKGKDNWELAAYPMEAHGFKTPSAWTDEYKRILKLFEETINRKSN